MNKYTEKNLCVKLDNCQETKGMSSTRKAVAPRPRVSGRTFICVCVWVGGCACACVCVWKTQP